MEGLGFVFGVPVGFAVFLIALLPLTGAIVNGLVAIGSRGGRAPVPKLVVNLAGVGFPLLSFALSSVLFALARDPATGLTTAPLWEWLQAGDFTAGVSFKVDRLSLTMSLVVTGVGSLIHLYSVGYMARDPGYARYFCYLNLFLFSMLLLVLAGNLPLLFVGWEGVGLCSYLLIGFWFEDSAKAYAGKKAFIVNRIGDAGFLLGMALLYSHLSSKGITAGGGLLSFETLELHRGDLFMVVTPACLLLFLGAVGKSAQIPLYVWLPDAMAGPTPVSALIHAATMVTAGVYMVARLHFLFVLSPIAMQTVATVGIATAFFAATMALAQNDFKKVLAYSTISQLGYMFFAVGSGAFSAAIFHLVTHAFFKACLFLCAGSVIHAVGGEQDIWKMGGLRHKMPVTYGTFVIAALALAGIAPFSGFFSKDAILWQGFAVGHEVLWVFGWVTAGLTASYMGRLLALVFLGRPRDGEVYYHAHEGPLTMTIPLVVLAFLSAVAGFLSVPEVLGGGERFSAWLAPLFPHLDFFEALEAKGHGLELLFMIGTLVWCFNLGLVASVLYSQNLGAVSRFVRRIAPLQRLVAARFYVDELFDRMIVRPIGWTADVVLWRFHDEKMIDGLLVHGTADGVGLLSKTLALLQNGLVQSYALFFAIGAIGLMAYLIL